MQRSVCVLLAFLCLGAPAGASEGSLTQLTGVTSSLLDGADEVIVSQDGKHVYAAGYAPDTQATQEGSLVAFSRDVATGALTQIDCATEVAVVGCEDATGISSADGIALSPDGEFVYAAGQNSDAVVVFDRNPADGTISQVSCVSETGAGICDDGFALDNPVGIAATEDNLYVASTNSDAVAVFDRNGTTGALTPTACISETGGMPCANGRGLDGPYPGIVLTADGTSVYVPSHSGEGIAVLDRDPSTGALSQAADTTGCIAINNVECTDVNTLEHANFIVEGPGSDHIYVASSISASITVFDRAADGNLAFDSCVADTDLGGLCTAGRGLAGMLGLGMSADGASLYGVGGSSDAISVFDRGGDGKIAQKPGTAGCIAENGDAITCADGTLLDTPRGAIGVSPDGKHVYVASSLSDAIAVFARTPNGRPTCAPVGAGEFEQDSLLELTLGCQDPDGDPVTLSIGTAPVNGTLGAIGAGGNVTYTPTAGYIGADSFTYRGSDAGGAGDAATASFSFRAKAIVATPTPTPTPAPTPVPTVPVRVSITQVATLPSAKKCVNRRRFRIKLRNVAGNRVVRAEIRVNGTTKRRITGPPLSLPIKLRGLPKRRWTLAITTTDASGKRVVGKRRYRSCAPRNEARA
jgi:DNA-binding beta-propeller fold protein YncE